MQIEFQMELDRMPTTRKDLITCSIRSKLEHGVVNRRRGVTCLNCDTAARGDLSEQSHSRHSEWLTSTL